MTYTGVSTNPGCQQWTDTNLTSYATGLSADSEHANYCRNPTIDHQLGLYCVNDAGYKLPCEQIDMCSKYLQQDLYQANNTVSSLRMTSQLQKTRLSEKLNSLPLWKGKFLSVIPVSETFKKVLLTLA